MAVFAFDFVFVVVSVVVALAKEERLGEGSKHELGRKAVEGTKLQGGKSTMPTISKEEEEEGEEEAESKEEDEDEDEDEAQDELEGEEE